MLSVYQVSVKPGMIYKKVIQVLCHNDYILHSVYSQGQGHSLHILLTKCCYRPGVFGGKVSPEKGIYGSVIFF